jgi:hypothetical protein
MAQKVILSPQSQVIALAPEPSFLTAASINGSLDIFLWQLGHMI